jgi:hypothetical protein
MLGALVGLRWHGVGMGKSLDGGGGLGNRDPSTTQRNSLRGFLCFAQDDNAEKRPRRCRGPLTVGFLFTLWGEGMLGAFVGLGWHGVGMGEIPWWRGLVRG